MIYATHKNAVSKNSLFQWSSMWYVAYGTHCASSLPVKHSFLYLKPLCNDLVLSQPPPDLAARQLQPTI